jgi:outer membrane protein assembly factor BamB
VLASGCSSPPVGAQDAAAGGGAAWSQFRGPHGDGRSEARGLPLTWSETNHVKWKTPIHGRAWSSPVVGDGQIWVTTATEDGRVLSALQFDLANGQVVRDLKLFEVEKPQFAHKFNTYASPTPVLENGRVYVTFGSPGTACLDAKTGRVLWERRDFVCNHYRGAGSSPILHGDLLIMNFDGSDHQFIVALDKRTGKTVWRKERSIDYKDLGPDGKPESEGDWRKAFSTPHVAVLNGGPVLISQGAKAVYGYEPVSGRELWRVEERTSHSASARPTTGQGLIFVNTGWSTGQILALRPGQDGEVLDANAETAPPSGKLQIAWKSKRNVPKKPSLQVSGDLLFAMDDGGIASCLEAATGKEVWRERIGGNYSASPLLADGRLYLFSEEGKTTVVAASREFQKLAENTLSDGFMASPAVSGQALILRTRTHLYRIE